MKHVVPKPGMLITEDVVFEPGVYQFENGEGIIIAAGNIKIDGNGAVLKGRGNPDNIHSYRGTGVYSNGNHNLTIKGLTVKGFQYGMKILNGEHLELTGNLLSDNYTDPNYGWGDGEPFAALYLENVKHSLIERNTGENVWNGLSMTCCDRNTVRSNHFSHCSNVCLKIWQSSHNLIQDNKFSHGIRIAPGEVHARDSASALIETGSYHNKFYRNDFTHGGDGVFIRSLNGIVSRFNYFEENDASWAHNNAWEVWDPDNTFVRNKGNDSSYGFWLGGSCHAVLIDNEAAYNGTARNNAPEPFGNAGIAVVNGSGSHVVMKNNHVHHNKSVGIAIGFKEGYESCHWIVQENKIANNETYGIYLKHAKWLDLCANEFSENKEGRIYMEENVEDVFEHEEAITKAVPSVHIDSDLLSGAKVNQTLQFNAAVTGTSENDEIHYRWNFGDGTLAEGAAHSHKYAKAGFYRVGVTAHNHQSADLDFHDLYVLDEGTLLYEDTDHTKHWKAAGGSANIFPIPLLTNDPQNSFNDRPALKIQSSSKLALLQHTLSGGGFNLTQADAFVLWVRAEHERQNGFAPNNFTIRFIQDQDHFIQMTPKLKWFDWTRISSESRYGWTRIEIPHEYHEDWHKSVIGSPDAASIRKIEILCCSEGGSYTVWLNEMKWI